MSRPEPDEEAIFHAVRKLPRGERAAYLEEACGDDLTLLRRIQTLLLVLDDDSGFLETPPEGCEMAGGESIAEGPGTMIGPYKLLEKIGEGGFGVVFMAEQSAPIRRRVALKVIKPGMDTRQVIARFEAERQALALMEHEHIARVLDGGETASGRPYFVMELVRGEPIAEYCDREQLSVAERLGLFVDVCLAVQHAHQKGVIHRDLKPSNVLVTPHDTGPVVKVIDFGIAKAVGQQLTDKTLFTNFNQMIGTPMYMSPEQAELSGLDVDTRSDVYALGVLLYELMTGTTPFDRERLRSAAFDEIRRIIREEEPAKPSTRISTLGDKASSLSSKRKSDPIRLSRLLRGELDWIAMKCLEKDRARRYETADGLARDVRRYLSKEPVEAGPPSTSYRLKKLLVRHKGPVLTVLLVLILLVAGIVGTTIGLIRAENQRVRAVAAEGETRLQRDRAVEAERETGVQRDKALAAAESAQRRLTQIEKSNSILASIFDDLDPNDEATDTSLRVRLASRLETAASQLEEEAVGDPLVVARLQCRLGSSLLELGHASRAAELFTKARPTLTDELGTGAPETLGCLTNLALCYRSMGKLEIAMPLAAEALQLATEGLGEDDPDTLGCMSTLAGIYVGLGKRNLAIPLYEETLALRREVLGSDHEQTIITMNNLAGTYYEAGRVREAIQLAEEAAERGERSLGPDHTTVLGSLNTLAVAHVGAGEYQIALQLQEEVCKRSAAKLGPDHPWTIGTMGSLGATYLHAGKLDQALPILERAATQMEKLEFESENMWTVIGNLEACLRLLKRPDDAERWRQRILAALKKRQGGNPESYVDDLASIAAKFIREQQWSTAESMLREVIEILQTHAPEPPAPRSEVRSGEMEADRSRRLINALEQMVQLYTLWGKPDEASRWRQQLDEAKQR
jgi:serine/threonine protein kinase/tetratricopeptide (TPR) repeat protein